MGRMAGFLAAAVLVTAACNGGDGQESTAAEPTRTLTVRVVAQHAGLGCVATTRQSDVDVRNESRLTVENESGRVLGTGTFELSPGAEVCDWTARVRAVPDGHDFYRLTASGELGTVSGNELDRAEWTLDFEIAVSGAVTLL